MAVGLVEALARKKDDARPALGLGTAAIENGDAFATASQGTLADSSLQPSDIGTTAGKVAAGDDARIVGTLQRKYLSVSAAAADSLLPSVKQFQTEFHTPLFAVPSTLFGGATYRRISFADLSGVPTQAYLRTLDRYLPDGTSDELNGGYWLIADSVIDWRMFGLRCDGSDDTVRAQAAIDFCAVRSDRSLIMAGTISVSRLTCFLGTHISIEAHDCYINANSSAAIDSLFEVKSPNFFLSGRLVLNCDYRLNYAAAFHGWHETAWQFNSINGVVTNAARVGIRVGNILYPDAVISETSFEEPHSYGVPVCLEIVGRETYVTINEPQLSSDDFGGGAPWIALPKIGLINVGATVTVIGGEIIMTAATNGCIVNHIPIDSGGGHVEWGVVDFQGVTVESASPLVKTFNPGLVINSPVGKRGLIRFSNPKGYHSQDLEALFQLDATYDDFLIIEDPQSLYHGLAMRTQPNVLCAAGSTAEVTIRGNFGPGFIQCLTGVSGGIVLFDSMTVCRAENLSGQAFTAASGAQAAIYQNKDLLGDRARFGSAYNTATGEFTVPVGGLQDVSVDVAFRLVGTSTGTIIIFVDGAEIQRKNFTGGIGNIRSVPKNLNAGQVVKVMVDIDANDTGSAITYLNVMAITARRR